MRKNRSLEKKIYTPRVANMRALEYRKHRGRKERLKNDNVRKYVITHLKKRWSPEQIAGRIKLEIKENISHEAIYQYIYNQVCSGSNLIKQGCEDLRLCLRRRRKIRLPHGARKCQRIFKSLGKSINERPGIVNERKRIGDWEGDTVESYNHKPGINTLVERKTGFTFITKLFSKTSASTIEAMSSRFREVPEQFKHTITLDNGPENRDWKTIENIINIDCYSANPYHLWERGTNENTNGLIRDYFPKKTDFDLITDEEIQWVEYQLNSRPRKRLGWRTPLEVWSGALQC